MGIDYATQIKIKPTIKVDPAQFDVEENLERHLPNW